jgi:hypothetical protein
MPAMVALIRSRDTAGPNSDWPAIEHAELVRVVAGAEAEGEGEAAIGEYGRRVTSW